MTAPVPDPAQRRPHPGPSAVVLRLRELAVVVALVAVAFSQAPGLLVADTKLDLVLDPARFLGRSLSAWDGTAAFGQLQNQAYGYLFPMGPFFLVGHLLAMPGWVVQRLWWSLLLVVACTGVLRLARLLGAGSHSSRLLAGAAYALSPRVLTTLGGISVESWPLALAPWALVPLVRGARGGNVRRSAITSALVVAAAGGVNAAATLALLPLPALFLLTREPGPRRTALLGWWSAGVVLATAWWVLPLVVLGRYAYPFLDHIETASVTTSVTSVPNALRGTSHWLAYVPQLGEPLWRAGFWLATSTVGVLATSAVVAVGLAGLALPRMPERRFLGLALLTGVVLVAVAHAGTVSSPVAEPVRQLLDGPLAPFRNVHKADLLVRLPLTLGLCHLLGAAPGWLRGLRARVPPERARRLGLPSSGALVAGALALTVVGMVTATWPAYRGDLSTRAPFAQVPAYWSSAAAWLNEHPRGRTLVVPGSAFGDYTWGRPGDDPLQALATSPWAVRNAVPLGAPGATRLLDAVGTELAAGRPAPGLATALARAGVGRVLLRNDLDPRASPDPAVASQATLSSSPGLRRVMTFGPAVGSALGTGLDLQGPVALPHALAVYDVRLPAASVVAVGRSGTATLSGGPEATLGLDRDLGPVPGALLDRPGQTHPLPARGPWLVTDTLRRRALNFGASVGAGYSPTLPRSTDPAAGRPAGDVLTDDDPAHQTTVRYAGARAVVASSTAADPFQPGWRGPGTRPYAAFDGDPTTAWVSSPQGGDQWVELRWSRPRRPGRVVVLPADEPGTRPVLAVRVETDRGAVRAHPMGGRFVAQLPAGATRRLRVVVRAAAGDHLRPVALAEVSVPGVRVTEHVVLPAAPVGSGWLLRRTPARRACIRPESGWLCSPALARQGEDADTWRRTLTAAGAQRMQPVVLVRARPGAALDRLLDRSLGYRATATSQLVDDPVARPGAAFDGDLGTAWVSGARDLSPTLRLDLPRPVTLNGLSVLAQPDTVLRLRSAIVTVDGARREARFGGRRVPQFAPVTGRQISVTFVRSDQLDSDPAPLRVEDVYLQGVAAPPRSATVTVPCTQGPVLRVGDHTERFALTASTRDMLAGTTLRATPCGAARFDMARGPTEVVAVRGPTTALDSVWLAPAGAPGSGPPAGAATRPVDVRSGAGEHRRVRVGPGGPAVLAMTEGANPGWRATTAGGVTLTPVRVDGWRQAWLLPGGGPVDVRLDFTPGRWHRAGLALGATALLLVVLLALVRGTGRTADRPAAGPAPARRLEGLVLAVGVPTLLGGPWGLGVGVAAVVVRDRLGRGVTAVGAAAAMVGAGVAEVASGKGAGGPGAQLLALAALALTAAALSPVRGRDLLVRRAVDGGDLPGEAAEQRLLQQQP